MSWTRILTLVGALLLPVSAALAQGGTGTVTGTVVDAQTARPLADVAVTAVGTGRSTVTGADGRYTLTQVPAGARTVRASRHGPPR